MRCLIIDGSGHAGGNTDKMCQMLKNALESGGCQTIIEHLGDGMVHCSGCSACHDSECPIDDSLAEVIKSLSGFDLLILASPIRFSGVSSQMKTFIDRLNPLWFGTGRMTPKVGAVLIGGSPEPVFRNAVSVLKSATKGTGSDWIGALEVPDTDRTPVENYLGDVEDFVKSVIGGPNNRTDS